MTFKIKSQIVTEEIPIYEQTQKIDVLKIKIKTKHPNTPIQIKLDDESAFRTQTDDEGVAECSTSIIQDYHVTVNIADETFEEDIKLK